MKSFLHTKKEKIIGRHSRPLTLTGVNLGGWLMMEAYILHAPNRAVKVFKDHFRKVLGTDALSDFEKNFRAQFISEGDFARIAGLGFNCVRVPFQYSLVEKKPYQYDPEGTSVLDNVIQWGEKYNLNIILDLHGACGSQNYDWHSDSVGKAELWTNQIYQKRTLALWEFLADRYKDKESLAGYDILNEAVTDDVTTLNRFYRQVIQTIRRVDRNHILFIEGNKWATDLNCLDPIDDDNYVLSIHNYLPIDFTFNYVPFLHYPLKDRGYRWTRETTRKHLSTYQKISVKKSVPILVGEFGVNARLGKFGEAKWVEDMLQCFRQMGFHRTYWTYKAVKNNTFPDGIFSYLKNPSWVNRGGPLTGWETYHLHWARSKQEIIRSWQTEQYEANKTILDVLKRYVHKDN